MRGQGGGEIADLVARGPGDGYRIMMKGCRCRFKNLSLASVRDQGGGEIAGSSSLLKAEGRVEGQGGGQIADDRLNLIRCDTGPEGRRDC